MPELTTGQSVLLTDLALCVNHYRLFTPGIYVCVHVPVLLDAQTRVVPGLVAMVNHGRLKQCEPLKFTRPSHGRFGVSLSQRYIELQSTLSRAGIGTDVCRRSTCGLRQW